DLTKNGINNKSPKFIASNNEIPDRIKLNSKCILVSRSGSLGLVNIVDDETINSILSSHIFKLELNTELVLPIYMEAFLRSTIGQIQIFRNNNGGVIPEINQDALKSIIVVVPPLDKQKEIANHITDIRQQAQQLKDKTKELLKKASEEIEEILLN
ncbi:MAG TPA: restriction endonuclease subunit S, partial [Bacteroidia bacterium]|nr:restriction endonuclease subunit S [Bacteroidia bacterium]